MNTDPGTISTVSIQIAVRLRPIYAARLDKPRPVVVLTRELVRPHMDRVTVAPITTTIRGLSTEVPVGRQTASMTAA
jgi:mRNA-degrading endonuclease toxin of MazEF toxin-antitoxin module